MSRLWNAELRLGLAPDAVVTARTPRGFGKTAAYTRVPGAGLEETLAAQPKTRADVHVVLSNHFIRYALLPWSAALKSDNEWLAFAQHSFQSTHGRVTREWTIACAPAERGAARLASAVDTARLAGIREAIRLHAHLQLRSVRPYLAVAFERMRAVIDDAPTWLAVREEGRTVLALVTKGRWIAVRARGGTGDTTEALKRAISLEATLQDVASRAERVVVVGGASETIDLASIGLRVVDRTLTAGAPLSHRAYSLAIA